MSYQTIFFIRTINTSRFSHRTCTDVEVHKKICFVFVFLRNWAVEKWQRDRRADVSKARTHNSIPGGAEVGLQLWVHDQVIVVLLLIKHCIFQADNCEAAFPYPYSHTHCMLERHRVTGEKDKNISTGVRVKSQRRTEQGFSMLSCLVVL